MSISQLVIQSVTFTVCKRAVRSFPIQSVNSAAGERAIRSIVIQSVTSAVAKVQSAALSSSPIPLPLAKEQSAACRSSPLTLPFATSAVRNCRSSPLRFHLLLCSSQLADTVRYVCHLYCAIRNFVIQSDTLPFAKVLSAALSSSPTPLPLAKEQSAALSSSRLPLPLRARSDDGSDRAMGWGFPVANALAIKSPQPALLPIFNQCSEERGARHGLIKMMRSYSKECKRKMALPSPRLRGEGAGGEGPNRIETLPLTPALSPAKPGGGEGENTRFTPQNA